jgi:multicomponent Na+:H+ antiporter subunit E
VRSFGYVIALAAIWVLMWGSASPANVLSGLVLGAVLVLLVPGLRRSGAGGGRVRPLGVLRLVAHMLVVTVTSNVELTRAVLSRSSRLRTAVVGVPLPECSDEVITLITDLIALSPGTMPIELRHDPRRLYVHVLHLRDVESFRREMLHLTDLVVRAFASNETIADQDAYMEAHGG